MLLPGLFCSVCRVCSGLYFPFFFKLRRFLSPKVNFKSEEVRGYEVGVAVRPGAGGYRCIKGGTRVVVCAFALPPARPGHFPHDIFALDGTPRPLPLPTQVQDNKCCLGLTHSFFHVVFENGERGWGLCPPSPNEPCARLDL